MKKIDFSYTLVNLAGISKEAINHCTKLVTNFIQVFVPKYMAGQREHGGNLAEKCTLKFMEEEVLDQWSYVQVAKAQWAEMLRILREEEQRCKIMGETLPPRTQKVLNILCTGNVRGERVTEN